MERPGDDSMEALAGELRRMKVEVSGQKPTGFVYHAAMLNHALSVSDEDLTKSHVENPYRLKSIVDRFEKSGIDKRCDTVADFEECAPELVSAVHPEPYFNYVDGYWEQNESKTKDKVVSL